MTQTTEKVGLKQFIQETGEAICAAIESYKAELLKEVGEPVAVTNHAQLGYVTDGMHPDIPLAMWAKETSYSGANIALYTSDQVAAAILKVTEPLKEEVARYRGKSIANAERTEAYLYENQELRAQLAAAQVENERLENQVLARDAELWGRTQEILGLKEQLAKEEQRVAELIGELEHTREQKNLLWFEFSIATQKLAAEQLNNKLLRDALQEYIDEHEECQDADDWMAMMCSVEAHHAADEALSQPSDTSALDSFVAEKVKELDEANEHHRQLARVSRDNELKATKQRDLAVEALEKWDMFFGGDAETAVLTIAEDPSTLTGCQKATKEAMSTIKESEAK